MNGKPSGTFPLFIFRATGQTSQQATVERPPAKLAGPLPIPRTGTAAPIGAATIPVRSRTAPERK